MTRIPMSDEYDPFEDWESDIGATAAALQMALEREDDRDILADPRHPWKRPWLTPSPTY